MLRLCSKVADQGDVVTERQCFAIFGTHAPACATPLSFLLHPHRIQIFLEGKRRGARQLLLGLHRTSQSTVNASYCAVQNMYIQLLSFVNSSPIPLCAALCACVSVKELSEWPFIGIDDPSWEGDVLHDGWETSRIAAKNSSRWSALSCSLPPEVARAFKWAPNTSPRGTLVFEGFLSYFSNMIGEFSFTYDWNASCHFASVPIDDLSRRHRGGKRLHSNCPFAASYTKYKLYYTASTRILLHSPPRASIWNYPSLELVTVGKGSRVLSFLCYNCQCCASSGLSGCVHVIEGHKS